MADTKRRAVTAAEQSLRVEQVVKLLIAGKLRHDILIYCREEFGLSVRQSDELMRKGRKLIHESVASVERHDYAANLIGTLHQILERSMASNNMSCALGAAQQLAKLTGVEPK
jgi:hypothetical protein